MLVLFDNGTPRGVAAALPTHTVEEARARGWDTVRNGELLDAAESAGFDATDRNIRYQQNLAGRRIAVVTPSKARWKLIRNQLAEVTAAVFSAKPGTLTEVDSLSGSTRRPYYEKIGVARGRWRPGRASWPCVPATAGPPALARPPGPGTRRSCTRCRRSA
jgi:hypothetical protein